MTTLSMVDVARYALAAGFRGEDAVIITAIATPESGRRTDAHGIGNPTYCHGQCGTRYPCGTGYCSCEDSWGLWQINRCAHSQYSALYLQTAAGNARAAFSVSGAGSTFYPWSTYKNGAHQAYMTQARAAVAEAGGMPPPPPPPGGTIETKACPWYCSVPFIGVPWVNRALCTDDCQNIAESTLGGAVAAIAGFFSMLFRWQTWVRVLEVIGGAAAVVLGLVFLAKSLGAEVSGRINVVAESIAKVARVKAA